MQTRLVTERLRVREIDDVGRRLVRSAPRHGLGGVTWRQAQMVGGTDHASHEEQASMIRRNIIWRNEHAYDERLRRVADRANVA